MYSTMFTNNPLSPPLSLCVYVPLPPPTIILCPPIPPSLPLPDSRPDSRPLFFFETYLSFNDTLNRYRPPRFNFDILENSVNGRYTCNVAFWTPSDDHTHQNAISLYSTYNKSARVAFVSKLPTVESDYCIYTRKL